MPNLKVLREFLKKISRKLFFKNFQKNTCKTFLDAYNRACLEWNSSVHDVKPFNALDGME